jgi:hypothetical protein
LATEINPVDKLSSTLWAKHSWTPHTRIVFNPGYALWRTEVPPSVPRPQLTGLRGFLPLGREKSPPGIQF